MIEVARFKMSHLYQMNLKETDILYLDGLTEAHKAFMENYVKFSYTLLINGVPIFCAGLHEIHKGRAEIWSFVDQLNSKPYFVIIHKVVKRFLEIMPYRRVEAFVEYNFEQGHRWMRLLGFRCECEYLESYFPWGGDASLYVKVKG